MLPPLGGGDSSPVGATAAARSEDARRGGGGRAYRMTLYCNGNPFYEGRTISVAPTRYAKLDELLVELDRTLPPAVAPLFGVRRLYTPAGGRPVRDLGELRDGGSYVCSGSEGFKNVGYGKVKAAPWCSGNADGLSRVKPNASDRDREASGQRAANGAPRRSGGYGDDDGDHGAPQPTGFRSSAPGGVGGERGAVLLPPLHFITRHLVASQRNALAASTDSSSALRLAESQLRRASLNKTATVLVARPGRCRHREGPNPPPLPSPPSPPHDAAATAAGCSAVCMLLSRQGLHSFEAFLADVSDAFGRRWRLNRVRQLYALSGREIFAIADLFRDDQVFVAVGRERVSRDDLALMMSSLFPNEPFPRELLRALRRRYASASENGKGRVPRRGPDAAVAAEGMRGSENVELDAL